MYFFYCLPLQLFLNPLEQVYGSQNVADILLKYCDKVQGSRNVLHALGYQLSYKEWIFDHESMDYSNYFQIQTYITTTTGLEANRTS